MNTYPTVTDKLAKVEGYAAITRPYSLRSENQVRMLNNVIQDMQGCDYRLVEE